MPHCSLHIAACCICCGLPLMRCIVFAQKTAKGQDHVLLLKGALVSLQCARVQIRGLVLGSVALRTPPQAYTIGLVIWNCAPMRIKGLGCSCPGS